MTSGAPKTSRRATAERFAPQGARGVKKVRHVTVGARPKSIDLRGWVCRPRALEGRAPAVLYLNRRCEVKPRPGVLQQERDRQQFWEALGLPDPVRVLAAEWDTRHIRGYDSYRHPDRDALDQFFETHPERRPSGWAHPYGDRKS